MPTAFWIGFAMIFGGQLVWMLAAQRAKAWLTANDPTYIPQARASALFLGMLLTSIKPVGRYAELRRGRGEPTTLAGVFWGGLLFSLSGVVVIFSNLR